MTKKEFENQRWSAGMKCVYEGCELDIIEVDFEQNTILTQSEEYGLMCLRHNEITLLKTTTL